MPAVIWLIGCAAQFLQTTPAKGSSKGQVQQMFKGMDTNKDNGVSQDEFDAFLQSMAGSGAGGGRPKPPPKAKKKPKPGSAGTEKELSALEKFYAKHGVPCHVCRGCATLRLRTTSALSPGRSHFPLLVRACVWPAR